MWREFVNIVINFFLNLIKLIKEKLNLPWECSNPTAPPRLPTFDLGTECSAQGIDTADGQSNNRRPHYHPPTFVQCPLIGVCVALVGITVQALQTYGLLNSRSFHWICMVLVFSLTAVLVSIYIQGDYRRASLWAVHAGTLIVFTALVAAIVVNIQLPFKVISVAVYLIGIFIIIVANLCKPKP